MLNIIEWNIALLRATSSKAHSSSAEGLPLCSSADWARQRCRVIWPRQGRSKISRAGIGVMSEDDHKRSSKVDSCGSPSKDRGNSLHRSDALRIIKDFKNYLKPASTSDLADQLEDAVQLVTHKVHARLGAPGEQKRRDELEAIAVQIDGLLRDKSPWLWGQIAAVGSVDDPQSDLARIAAAARLAASVPHPLTRSQGQSSDPRRQELLLAIRVFWTYWAKREPRNWKNICTRRDGKASEPSCRFFEEVAKAVGWPMNGPAREGKRDTLTEPPTLEQHRAEAALRRLVLRDALDSEHKSIREILNEAIEAVSGGKFD